MTTVNRVSGGLLRVLKASRVAWYRGIDGATAYYEQPSMSVPGAVFVNGKRVTELIVDPEGFYADHPSPGVQKLLEKHGIQLERGWTCAQEAHGMEINDAVRQSYFRAVRHHNGDIRIQCIDDQRAAIFVDDTLRWNVRIKEAHRALAELGVSTLEGWYPLQQNLL